MVAIVLPRPLPRSVEQEALLCVPEGQEAWLTIAEPAEKPKNKHKDTSTHLSVSQANSIFALFSLRL